MTNMKTSELFSGEEKANFKLRQEGKWIRTTEQIFGIANTICNVLKKTETKGLMCNKERMSKENQQLLMAETFSEL